MRRVREYVEVHLGESIDLSMLAGVAGLSVHHFARHKHRAEISRNSGVEHGQEMLFRRISLAELRWSCK